MDKLPTATRLSHTDDSLYMLMFIICGIIGAVLVSAVALYCTRKQSRLKDKLHKIGPSLDQKIGKDYQDLCQTKTTSKSSPESSSMTAGRASAVSGQLITSLSRESDNSQSSRSSTLSWSEEPMTNMDITTGHMVLAYMEDHLNNKARLDTEWAALCAYDADLCSVAIAQLKENLCKNRYMTALPYDHTRVKLNALSNVTGSDYINASTITDHDPQNAAYITTQGPLENTVNDFWQMIWEQGCVVIVMLTQLVENDTSMCYQYWPMDGSHLYDIYEVHLVSEHIWCDDFLVRSFYLKNVKTTETRTVTQFHFLTWPEGGIPLAMKPLLEFRRKVNKSFRRRSCPIVVHCSDGVGRTGSYLLLDMVMNRILKGAKEIDIAATLEHLRDQCAGAVCTKQQFQFVLSAVAEEVQAALRALPQQQSSQQDQPSAVDNAM
ncbi:receptor-type tyrosine-protein phosphatase N2-like isoform X1 [Planococcus citri]|uniref:receptor-type tyrosine-protein phosphatase N2-like isoform X1 n=2 Tax=Planococcus citri TaxID=170843 RepID=UPI0031F9FFE2